VKDIRVRETLAKLSNRPPTEWAANLEKEFPDDPAMRRQALLWLHADQHAIDDERDPPSLGEPTQQRYELAVRLDTGATASVWQAFDRKLGRNVAIKVFHDREGSEAIDQVIAEAQTASDVISDHVVRVLDVHGDDPRPYIVMELVGEHDPERGEVVLGTAASSCPPADIDEVARWVMHVARGVHDAHLRNVFHRDLKPQNVLVTPITRRARIADFGLAVSGASEHVGHPAMTLVKRGPAGPVSVRGTPEYMAPEQARGLPLALDPRAADDRAVLLAVDIWGLGAIAYDLLAGRAPWSATADLSPWEVAASGRPPPLPTRTAHGARIPARLRRIVDKAMATEPGERYASAAQVANELQAYLAKKPTTLDRARALRFALWCRRSPQLALTALIAVVLTLLALGTHATVTRLRGERNALRQEVADQTAEQARLTTSVQQAHTDLGATQVKLASERKNLDNLETSIRDERTSYATLVETKEKALRDANTATRGLIEQLEAAKRDREAAEQARASYEALSTETRQEAERAAKDRDRVRKDRDTARAERDAALADREVGAAERERLTAALRQAQEELAHLKASQPARTADTRLP
jgi:serine/threonine-protein kinase